MIKTFKILSLLLICWVVLASAQTASVITENANLRGTPSASGAVVTTLELNSTVEVIKQSGTWFLVQSTEYAGWMHGNTIRFEAKPASLYSAPITKTPKASTKRSSASRYYTLGPRGGCYYINGNGNKTYVSRSLCN